VQIDWFTLIAQVVNFLVLVWLLQRFLYGRIVRAMDEREAHIASRLEEASRLRAETEREATEYRSQKLALEEQREQVLLRSREQAEAQRQQLIDEARREIENMREQWLDALQQEKKQFFQDFREKIGQQVVMIVRRALHDLASVELQEPMTNSFLDRLEKLEPSGRQVMVDAIRASEREVEIRSAFPMNSRMRERIIQALRDHLDDGVAVRFEVEPALGCGIELHAHAQRLAWNLNSYLEGLEDAFVQELQNKAMEHGAQQQSNSGQQQWTAPVRP